jgi:hypothetical protein
MTTITLAQTGPGGVGNTNGTSGLPHNIVWLDASDLSGSLSDGFTWPDKSGNGYDAIEENTGSNVPSLSTLNGVPAIQFNGQDNEYFIIADDQSSGNLLDNASQFSVFAVYQVGTSDPRCIISKRTRYQNDMSWVMFHNEGYKAYSYVSNGTYGGSITLSQNTSYLQSLRINSSLSSNSVQLHVNGASAGQAGSNVSVADYDDDVLIGLFNYGDVRAFNGKIAEIIVFRDALSDVEFSILNNYLAAKYQLTITGDLYAHESTHRYGLVGVGQASDGSSQTSATGEGILTISSPSSLSNSEYLLAAHDGASTELVDTCDAPGFYGKRMLRSWRVDHTGDVGTVSLSFDLSGISGLGTQSQLALIQTSSSDFSDATVHITGVSLVGSNLSFTNVDLSDGDIFTIAQLGSTVYFNGSWNNGSGAANSPSDADASKKFIVSSGSASISSNASCECAIIESGTDLSVTNEATFTVNNGIVNNGSMYIASASSLLQRGSAINSGSGNYVVQRNSGTIVDDTRYQYWSSPISNATMGASFVGANTSDFYYFDEGTTNNWASQPSGSAMTPGRGYITTGTIGISNSSETRIFDGNVNNGTVQFTTSNVSSGEFILAGNPYPSAISSTDFIAANGGLSGTLWFWNHSTAQVGGANDAADYATWTGLGSTGGNTAKAPDDYIQSAQGFFVEASSSNPTIAYSNEIRVSGNNSQFFKMDANQTKNRAWLSITNDSNDYNQVLVGFADDATDGVDRLYDGKKFKAHPRIAFYSLIDSVDYSIQGLKTPIYLQEKRIPLGIDAWISGSHTIKIDSLDNWPADYSIMLIDHELDSIHDLRVIENYRFEVIEVGVFKNRFELGITNTEEDEEPTGITPINSSFLTLFSSNGEVIIESESAIKRVLIHDVQGRLISDVQPSGTRVSVPVPNAQLAIVSVELTNGTITKKLLHINL